MELFGYVRKSVGGFYHVETEQGMYLCTARGKFRKARISPYAGDRVRILGEEDRTGAIQEILPRKNFLVRPPVANLDRLFLVTSVRDPGPEPLILDKTIAVAELAGIEPVLVVTKTDLEQAEGEYYPKTLTRQVREAQDLAEHMSRLARLDSLTGLLNHRTFFEEGERYIRQGGTFWCFVLDLDDFKLVNDTLGHLAGDEVLKRIASILRSSVRNQDLVGRVGGDEFTLLCAVPRGEAEVAVVARRILTKVGQQRENWSVWPGMSIGIAKVRGGAGLRDAFYRADAALYRVKRGAKNDFCIDTGE